MQYNAYMRSIRAVYAMPPMKAGRNGDSIFCDVFLRLLTRKAQQLGASVSLNQLWLIISVQPE